MLRASSGRGVGGVSQTTPRLCVRRMSAFVADHPAAVVAPELHIIEAAESEAAGANVEHASAVDASSFPLEAGNHADARCEEIGRSPAVVPRAFEHCHVRPPSAVVITPAGNSEVGSPTTTPALGEKNRT